MNAPRKKTLILMIGPVLIAGIILSAFFIFKGAGRGNSENPSEKSIRLSFELHNRSQEFIASSKLVSYLPVNANEYQELIAIDSPVDHSVFNEEEHGDIELHVHNLPPYGYRTVSFTATVRVFDSPKYLSIDKSQYLTPDKYIEIQSPEVLSIAENLIRQGVNAPESIYKWVRDNVEDVGYVSKNKGAKYALTQRQGDCTEYMYAFIALARANGIPARGVAGFFVEGNASLVSSSDYHNWAEYHDGEKWILVDPYKGYFNQMYKNYIAFRFIGSGPGGQSDLSASRFMSADERVSVNL